MKATGRSVSSCLRLKFEYNPDGRCADLDFDGQFRYFV